MNEKTLRVLEFNKIKELLIDKCESRIGKEYAKKISPITNIKEIDLMQQETEEALSLLIKRGKPPLYGIHSISYEIKRVEIGGVLNPASLIKVSDSLRVSRGLKNYIKETKADKMPTYLIIGELIDNLRVYKNIEDEINNAIINENEISDNASSRS